MGRRKWYPSLPLFYCLKTYGKKLWSKDQCWFCLQQKLKPSQLFSFQYVFDYLFLQCVAKSCGVLSNIQAVLDTEIWWKICKSLEMLYFTNSPPWVFIRSIFFQTVALTTVEHEMKRKETPRTRDWQTIADSISYVSCVQLQILINHTVTWLIHRRALNKCSAALECISTAANSNSSMPIYTVVYEKHGSKEFWKLGT